MNHTRVSGNIFDINEESVGVRVDQIHTGLPDCRRTDEAHPPPEFEAPRAEVFVHGRSVESDWVAQANALSVLDHDGRILGH